MKINYNSAAMHASNAVNRADNRVSKALGKLSSGLKLTAAKDSPAGYAIGRRMNAQIEGLAVATKSANDGISVIETADGALTEVHDMLQRMNELAVKGATGTLTTTDRSMLDKELQHLKEEITRIATDTEFNSQTLLDGSFDLKGYTNNQDVKVDFYATDVLSKVYTIDALDVVYDSKGKIDLDATKATLQKGTNFPGDVEVTSVASDKVTLSGSQGFEITIKVKAPETLPDTVQLRNVTLDITGIGTLDTQIGANEGQQLAIRIPTISLDRMGIEKTDVTTQEKSDDAITEIKGAILYVSDARSQLGAYQNRLEHTVSSLSVTSENMTSAYSRIMDVDMAEEMTNYTTQQVIAQAATSMLAQANERPAQVLQLLQ